MNTTLRDILNEKLKTDTKLAAELAHQEHVFRDSLRKTREARGMTLAQVAEKLGITEEMAAEVESSSVNPTLSEIRYYLWAIGAYYTATIHPAEEL